MTGSNCYSAMTMTADTIYGFFNPSYTATITGCYYDSTLAPTVEANSGTGLTTTEMKDKANFTGWDFDTVWDIDPSINDGYPFLR